MAEDNKKSMTIDDLAVVMQSGFVKAKEDNDALAIMVSEGFENTAKDIAGLKTELSEVKHEVAAVKSNVNNYLELSEKRYSELKQRDSILAKWIKLVADKTGVPIDVSQLEKI